MVYSTLNDCPALVLNADFRPLSYFPLSVWGWQDAVKAVICDRVAVLSQYDMEVHSPSFTMQLPQRDCVERLHKAGPQAGFYAF